MKTAKLLKIHGLVQGVFFRESLKNEALRLQISGWVKNRSDGTVEAFVQGEAEAVREIECWAQRGPIRARVEKVEAVDAIWDSHCVEFKRLPTD